MTVPEKSWDIFISHASEDKKSLVRPLADSLARLGVRVWYDEFELHVGDSLSRSIDKGLAGSRYGLVVISRAFIGRHWPEYELRGLVARESPEDKVILPLWHGVTKDDVLAFSPPLADKLAIDTAQVDAVTLALTILREVRPDIYSSRPRSELESIASGHALDTVQEELDLVREELAAAKAALEEFSCPDCGAPLGLRAPLPDDPEQYGSATLSRYECGRVDEDGLVTQPCPTDPRFPSLDDYELVLKREFDDGPLAWVCRAHGKTPFARNVLLLDGRGRSEEEARQALVENYERIARHASR